MSPSLYICIDQFSVTHTPCVQTSTRPGFRALRANSSLLAGSQRQFSPYKISFKISFYRKEEVVVICQPGSISIGVIAWRLAIDSLSFIGSPPLVYVVVMHSMKRADPRVFWCQVSMHFIPRVNRKNKKKRKGRIIITKDIFLPFPMPKKFPPWNSGCRRSFPCPSRIDE